MPANTLNRAGQVERIKVSDRYGNDLNGVMKVARLIAAANTDNATALGATSVGGSLRRISGYNAKAGVLYIKLYDKLAAPVVGDTPVATIAIGASQNFSISLEGLKFVNGIGYRTVTGSADSDATAVAANDLVGVCFFWDN